MNFFYSELTAQRKTNMKNLKHVCCFPEEIRKSRITCIPKIQVVKKQTTGLAVLLTQLVKLRLCTAASLVQYLVLACGYLWLLWQTGCFFFQVTDTYWVSPPV